MRAQSNSNTQHPTQNFRPCIRQKCLKLTQMELRPAEEETSEEASEPQAKPNHFPHVSPLESHHEVSPNEGHPPRQATFGSQKHPEHLNLHTVGQL